MPNNPTWKEFEDLACRILEANRFTIHPHFPRGDQGFDFTATLADEKWAIEVKYYRTARAQPTLIEAAATRLINNGIQALARKGMLVVSCYLQPELRIALEAKFNISFVDRIDLKMWSADSPSLSDQLDALLEVRAAETPINEAPPRSRPILASQPLAPTELDLTGRQLCAELKSIKPGKTAATKYEKTCEKILKYLFPNHLEGWHRQQKTKDDLNHFDYICRIRSNNEFWEFVTSHLQSRYALFEFKNYSEKITQGQILTTEKYLFERGLRKFALIMTRKGAPPMRYP